MRFGGKTFYHLANKGQNCLSTWPIICPWNRNNDGCEQVASFWYSLTYCSPCLCKLSTGYSFKFSSGIMLCVKESESTNMLHRHMCRLTRNVDILYLGTLCKTNVSLFSKLPFNILVYTPRVLSTHCIHYPLNTSRSCFHGCFANLREALVMQYWQQDICSC